MQSSSIGGSGVSSVMKDLTQRLTTMQRQNIMKLLQGAATDVARVLGLPQDLVRSNLFEMSDNDQVRIILLSREICCAVESWRWRCPMMVIPESGNDREKLTSGLSLHGALS